MKPKRDRGLRRTVRFAAPLALWTTLAPPAAAAQNSEGDTLSPGDVVDLVPEALSKVGVRLYAEESASLFADFGPADASEFRTTLGVRAGGPISKSLALRASALGRISVYGYDGNRDELEVDLGGVDLFQRLFDFQFGLGGAYQITRNWSVFAEGRANLRWEDGATLSDAVTGSGTLGIGFALEPHLEIALGVDVGTSLDEGGVNVSPAFGFRWRIRDGMRLESDGLGLLFAMDLLPELELQLRGSYESDRYRLDQVGGPFPDQTLRQREAPVLVALRWTPNKHWRITGGAGSVVHQQWKVEADDDEGNSSTVDAGPAPLLYLRIQYRF